MNKYIIKLKGTDCYLKSTGEKAINFTTDINKAKVFERILDKPDIIDKLMSNEYKVRRESFKTDHIRLTMDKSTWQKMFNEHLDKIQEISNNRLSIHQYSNSLVKKFESKAKAYQISEEFPNFNCDYYGEDFERKFII